MSEDISKDLNYLIKIFREKLILNPNENHLPDLIHKALSIVMKIQGIKSSSLFLLNNETIEFEQRATLPYEQRYDLLKDYEQLINNGQIGLSVTTADIIDYKLEIADSNSSKHYLVCPLLTGNGVMGLVLLLLESEQTALNYEWIDIFEIWLAQVATQIENLLLRNEIDKSRATIEQKLAAKTMTISQSKRELEAILNSVQAAILVIDPETQNIISANPVAISVIGDLSANIVGKNALDYFRDDAENNFYDEQVKFSKSFESSIFNVRDVPVPILRSTATINIGNQRLRIESFFDITDRKMNEIALRQANELLELKVQERTEDLQVLVYKLRDEVAVREKAELEVRKMLIKEQELNEMKSKFVSLVSHEFRTPLTIIRSAAQVLQKYHNQIQPEQVLNYLTRIIYTVDNMTDLMENVLFIGKTDSSKFKYNPKQVNVVELVQGIIEDSILNNKSNNRIVSELEINNPLVNLDEVLIRQIMLNLLSNALKYSKEDTDIIVRVNEQGEHLCFEVQDYGIGIPEGEQNKIFEQFYRGSNVGIINGTGLGMTVVLRSLKMHNGKIEISSELDKGTLLKVLIPKSYEQ